MARPITNANFPPKPGTILGTPVTLEHSSNDYTILEKLGLQGVSEEDKQIIMRSFYVTPPESTTTLSLQPYPDIQQIVKPLLIDLIHLQHPDIQILKESAMDDSSVELIYEKKKNHTIGLSILFPSYLLQDRTQRSIEVTKLKNGVENATSKIQQKNGANSTNRVKEIREVKEERAVNGISILARINGAPGIKVNRINRVNRVNRAPEAVGALEAVGAPVPIEAPEAVGALEAEDEENRVLGAAIAAVASGELETVLVKPPEIEAILDNVYHNREKAPMEIPSPSEELEAIFAGIAVSAYEDNAFKASEVSEALPAARIKQNKSILEQNIDYYDREPESNSSHMDPYSRDIILSFFTKTKPSPFHTQLKTTDTHHMLDFFRTFLYKEVKDKYQRIQTRDQQEQFTENNPLVRNLKEDLKRYKNFTFISKDNTFTIHGNERLSEQQRDDEVIPIMTQLSPQLAEIVCNFNQHLYGSIFSSYIHDISGLIFIKPAEYNTLIMILPDKIVYHLVALYEQAQIELNQMVEKNPFIGEVTIMIDPRTLEGFIQFDKYDIHLMVTSLVDQFFAIYQNNFKIASRNAQLSVLDVMLKRMIERMKNRIAPTTLRHYIQNMSKSGQGSRELINTFSNSLVKNIKSAQQYDIDLLRTIVDKMEPNDDIKKYKIDTLQEIRKTVTNPLKQFDEIIKWAERYFRTKKGDIVALEPFEDLNGNQAWYDVSRIIPPKVIITFDPQSYDELIQAAIREIKEQPEVHTYIYTQFMNELEKRMIEYDGTYFKKSKILQKENRSLYVLFNDDKLSELFRKIKESRAANAADWFPSLSGIFRRHAITGEIEERAIFHKHIYEQTLHVCEANLECAKAAAYDLLLHNLIHEIGLYLRNKNLISYTEKKMIKTTCDIIDKDPIFPEVIEAEKVAEQAIQQVESAGIVAPAMEEALEAAVDNAVAKIDDVKIEADIVDAVEAEVVSVPPPSLRKKTAKPVVKDNDAEFVAIAVDTVANTIANTVAVTSLKQRQALALAREKTEQAQRNLEEKTQAHIRAEAARLAEIAVQKEAETSRIASEKMALQAKLNVIRKEQNVERKRQAIANRDAKKIEEQMRQAAVENARAQYKARMKGTLKQSLSLNQTSLNQTRKKESHIPSENITSKQIASQQAFLAGLTKQRDKLATEEAIRKEAIRMARLKEIAQRRQRIANEQAAFDIKLRAEKNARQKIEINAARKRNEIQRERNEMKRREINTRERSEMKKIQQLENNEQRAIDLQREREEQTEIQRIANEMNRQTNAKRKAEFERLQKEKEKAEKQREKEKSNQFTFLKMKEIAQQENKIRTIQQELSTLEANPINIQNKNEIDRTRNTLSRLQTALERMKRRGGCYTKKRNHTRRKYNTYS